MRKSPAFIRIVCLAATALAVAAQPQTANQTTKPKLYNLAKQNLLEGKQVFSFTQSKFDIPAYCEAAKHYDFVWFEMQHSTLEFKDVEAMIAACPYAGAAPMIRLPDAQEWHIQHATDIGALGVIIPTVDDVDRAREGAKWARYPPVARRSAGAGQAARPTVRGDGDRPRLLPVAYLLLPRTTRLLLPVAWRPPNGGRRGARCRRRGRGRRRR